MLCSKIVPKRQKGHCEVKNGDNRRDAEDTEEEKKGNIKPYLSLRSFCDLRASAMET
jgi:hypothetical protein